ncbi:conserved hypothetical protein [Carnobacterium maltaromaticum]|nr:conserved hypothetical protein [Carnobacterium maltaromaticum]
MSELTGSTSFLLRLALMSQLFGKKMNRKNDKNRHSSHSLFFGKS